MTYRDDNDALHARIAEVESDLHKALVRERELRVSNEGLGKTITDLKTPPPAVRWFSLLERAGRFIAEIWKITAWGATVCGMVLLFACLVARGEYDDCPGCKPCAVCATPASTITPLGRTCNGICNELGMRHVSHWDYSGSYDCTCASHERICTWNSRDGMDCASTNAASP